MSSLKKISALDKIVAFTSGIISIGLIIFFSSAVNVLLDFQDRFMNPYNQVYTDNHIRSLKLAIILLIVFCIFISISILLKLHIRFLNLFSAFFNTNTIFSDSLTSKKNISKIIFVISTGLAFILHIKYLLVGDTKAGLREEPLLEHLTSLLLAFSAIILLLSLFNIKKSNATNRDTSIIKKWLLGFSLALLFVFFEEISWGQQFFNWESSGVFKDSNMQSETNLHNFINPFYRFIYPLVGMGLFIVTLLLWFYYRLKKPYWLELVIPHQSQIYLIFFMACTSFLGHSELFEQLLYLFIFLYSIRIFVCLKYPSKLNQTTVS